MALVPAARSAVVALDANMAIDSAASLEHVVAITVLVVAAAASLVPARRASRIEPVVALRDQ